MYQAVLSMKRLKTAEVLRRAPVLIVSLILGKNEPSRGYSSIRFIKMS